MREVFADTFYWIALTVPTEAAHGRASQFTGNIVTTDEVLSEYLTFLAARRIIFGARPGRRFKIFFRMRTYASFPKAVNLSSTV